MAAFGKLGGGESGPKYAKSEGLDDASLISQLYREGAFKDSLKRLAELRDPERNMNQTTGDDRKLIKEEEAKLRACVNALVGSKRGDRLEDSSITAAVDRILEVEKQYRKSE